MEGLRAGFQVLHTAVGSLARGTSNPAVETTLRNLEAEGYSHRLDEDALAAVAEHFAALAEETRAARRPSAGVRRDLLPPSAGRRHGLDDAAHARGAAPARAVPGRAGGVARVRAEMGYPITSRRSRSSSPPRRSGTSSTASAGRPSPTRRCVTSSATTGSPPRRPRGGRPRAVAPTRRGATPPSCSA